jgi:hypothetical protein
MIITILTLVISRFITNFSAGAAFGEKTIDYAMSDMYNTVTNRRAVRYLSNDIVIVATDNCSRIDIANIILEVNKYAPLAVGIDIFFPYETGNDSSILFALNSCQNLVLPMQLPDSTKPQNNNFYWL